MKRIISGGQTGADRAALDACLDLGYPLGGYCPKGRIAEDGLIGIHYDLVEIEGGYRQRTKKNVMESDGTVIFYGSDLTGGSEQTAVFAIKGRRPYKLIDVRLVSESSAVEALINFIESHNIRILNVAGPREESCAGIYNYVKHVILRLIELTTQAEQGGGGNRLKPVPHL